jgi:hypothetical protein
VVQGVPDGATLSRIYVWQQMCAPQFAVFRLASWPRKCTSGDSGSRRQYCGVRRRANRHGAMTQKQSGLERVAFRSQPHCFAEGVPGATCATAANLSSRGVYYRYQVPFRKERLPWLVEVTPDGLPSSSVSQYLEFHLEVVGLQKQESGFRT